MATALVGVFILYSTWQLFDCIRRGAVAQHPLFATQAPGGAEGPYKRYTADDDGAFEAARF